MIRRVGRLPGPEDSRRPIGRVKYVGTEGLLGGRFFKKVILHKEDGEVIKYPASHFVGCYASLDRDRERLEPSVGQWYQGYWNITPLGRIFLELIKE